MVNSNLNVQIFPFFDSVKNPITTDQTSDSFHNNGYDRLTIEVSGSGSGKFEIQGCVNTQGADGQPLDDANCSWTSTKVLDITDYEMKDKIEATGIFQIVITGMSRVRVKATDVSGTGLTVVGALSRRY